MERDEELLEELERLDAELESLRGVDRKQEAEDAAERRRLRRKDWETRRAYEELERAKAEREAQHRLRLPFGVKDC